MSTFGVEIIDNLRSFYTIYQNIEHFIQDPKIQRMLKHEIGSVVGQEQKFGVKQKTYVHKGNLWGH